MDLVKITKAIFNNENSIMPISVLNDGVYDCEKEVNIGLSSILNRKCVHHIVKFQLTSEEKLKLKNSASILRNKLNEIGY